MRICGLIVEYNPFHNGHLHHFKSAVQTTSADYTVAVMSGHFLQRGEPALVDKWTRAHMAVLSGVDLVIELPTYYATSSAEGFAFGAIKLLSQMGVDNLCFGAEQPDIALLKRVAHLIDSENSVYQTTFKACLKRGCAFHMAKDEAIKAVLDVPFSFSANNILAIEYIRAVAKLGYAMRLVPTKRIAADYLQTEITADIASATAIRKLFDKRIIHWQALKKVVPQTSYDLLYEYPKYTTLNDFKWLFNAIAIREATHLKEIRGVKEGLENRLLENLSNVSSLEDYVATVATRRYPKTRIQRIIINSLLGITKDDQLANPDYLDYARILAYNKNGAKLIRHFKKREKINLFTNLARDLKKYRKDNPLINLDIKATDMYSQVSYRVNLHADYFIKPIKVE